MTRTKKITVESLNRTNNYVLFLNERLTIREKNLLKEEDLLSSMRSYSTFSLGQAIEFQLEINQLLEELNDKEGKKTQLISKAERDYDPETVELSELDSEMLDQKFTGPHPRDSSKN